MLYGYGQFLNYVIWIQRVSLYIKADDIYNDIAKNIETRFQIMSEQTTTKSKK